MAIGWGTKCIKDMVFLFNLIFWLCGLALIVVGILVQLSLQKSFITSNVSASGAPIILIGVGVVIFFVAFFGCCGAWKEDSCMVTTFAFLLLVIILVEIAAVIAGYIFRNKVEAIAHNSLTDLLENYNTSSPEFRDSVDKLQKDLKCCGVNSSSDWRNFDLDGNSVPDSCCLNVSANCGKGAMTDASKVHVQGCRTVVEAFLRKNIMWVIVAALVTTFLQMMGIVFACLLIRGIQSG